MVLKPFILKRTMEAPLRRALMLAMEPAVNAITVKGVKVPLFQGSAHPNEPYPYAVIGESIDEPSPGTKTSEEDSRRIMFHVYTEEDGYDLAHTIKDAMLAVFSQGKQPFNLNAEDPTWNLYSIELLPGGRSLRVDPPTGPRYAHVVWSMRFDAQDLKNKG
jgi:hypothetical protein